jgi:predicted nuclease of predicted toxin-antitoxin system
VKGILADNNIIGQVAHLAQRMQTEPWADFWQELHLVLRRFEDVGLAPNATDVEIWQRCQAEELILITDNRNDESPDSLTAAIRDLNTPTSLPVFTIGNLAEFVANRDYEERVLDTLYNYLLRIDDVRGTGRLYLP